MRYLLLLSTVLLMACFSNKEEKPAEYSGKEEVGDQLLVSETDLSYEEKVKLQGELIKAQEQQLKRQDKELEHYQRQDYYNKALEKYTK